METEFDSKLYKYIIITIDGTAASGKGTIVRGLKQYLDNRYKTLDAGLMYRALTYFYIQKGIDNGQKLILTTENLENRLNEEVKIDFDSFGKLVLNGNLIDNSYLRGPEIDPYVGGFAAIDEIKLYIINRQKKIIKESNCGWILDGRCMGTAVAPQAQVKFYMDAPLLVRATRRHGDYVRAKKFGYSTEDIAIDLEQRDKMDKATHIAPLKKPHDAIEIDSFKYSPESVVEKAVNRVKQKIIEAGKV